MNQDTIKNNQDDSRINSTNQRQSVVSGRDSISKINELTVCDIIGAWGSYQTSLTAFALLYSALAGIIVVVGPIWTPNMRHICFTPQIQDKLAKSNMSSFNNSLTSDNFTLLSLQDSSICFLNDVISVVELTTLAQPEEMAGAQTTLQQSSEIGLINDILIGDKKSPKECQEFLYEDADYGKVLTNTFDLVCSHKWLRSFPSSSALTGMLLSSVTLGVLADKYGRMSCIKVGFVLSILATIGAIIAQNYFLLNVCFMLMSYAQMGVANALATLAMEATSPKYRFVPIFQFGFGWGIGMILVPIIHALTMNYQYFLIVLLTYQLVLMVWLRYGVFESIRWLLSEGKITQAQIELQRACHWNKVKNGSELAQKIAQVQIQQVRKASQVILEKTGPLRLAHSTNHIEIDNVADELNILGAAIRHKLSIDNSNLNLNDSTNNSTERGNSFNIEMLLDPPIEPVAYDNTSGRQSLSPTLARHSFSIQNLKGNQGQLNATEAILGQLHNPRQSITTQCLIQLALKYSKTLQKQEEGTFFLIQMFHRRLAKPTIVLMLLSVMLETSYYGLIQTNGFVGTSISLNYLTGAISEWVAALCYVLLLYIFSRRIALITPTLLTAFVCIGIALTYHLMPDNGNKSIKDDGKIHSQLDLGQLVTINVTDSRDEIASFIADKNLTSVSYSNSFNQLDSIEISRLRDGINFWLTTFGKLTVTAAIQTAATISMEIYPNNLRQTGPGVIVFVGRIGSIIAPFLFNDHTDEKTIFKITLVSLACFGLLVCIMVPFFIRNTKDKELCDRLNDIKD